MFFFFCLSMLACLSVCDVLRMVKNGDRLDLEM